jgi:hypothetical protein
MNVFICESIIILLGIYNNKKVFGNWYESELTQQLFDKLR